MVMFNIHGVIQVLVWGAKSWSGGRTINYVTRLYVVVAKGLAGVGTEI